jgi:hypothetical protein
MSPNLVMTELSRKFHSRFLKRIANSDTNLQPALPTKVRAGEHVFLYRRKGELRFGPPYYKLTALGPFADKFNRLFKGGDYFHSAYPFNSDGGLYVLERAVDAMRLRQEISVYNLANGRKLGSIEGDYLSPHLWRPRSDELILFSRVNNTWKKWKVRSRTGDRIVDLDCKGNECRASADGRYLILNETGLPFVCLYDLEEERVLHTLTKRDFRKHTPKPGTLSVIKFDPVSVRLTLLVNSTYRFDRKPSLAYDLAVSVEIAY